MRLTDMEAAEKLFRKVVWWKATIIEILEVDPEEVARVRNWKQAPEQMALPGM